MKVKPDSKPLRTGSSTPAGKPRPTSRGGAPHSAHDATPARVWSLLLPPGFSTRR
jgi:hypothetical protein